MSSESVNLNSSSNIRQLLSNNNIEMSDEELLSVFSDSMNSETSGVGELASEWIIVEAEENKTLGFLWKTGTYTYNTSSEVEITLEDTENVQILENSETGEVIVIGADGAKIKSGSKDATLKIYDSNIEKIETGKGNDNIRIYNSNLTNINTGKGTDSITIEDSVVDNLNTGSGNDFVSVSDSEISGINTSSNFLWGILDNGEDTIFLENTEANEIKTGRGSDNIIATDSAIDTLKTGGGSNLLNINETQIDNLKTNKKDMTIYNSSYLDIDKETISKIKSDAQITLEDGSVISVNDYTNYILSQEIGFQTEEEYQEYVISVMTSNLESMKSTFEHQEDADGAVSDGYNLVKELSGLGITSDDAEAMIAEQEAIIEGLTAALNGKTTMSFEEAYEYYTGTVYSQEKIDKYMEVSQMYSAVMVGCQYDEDYIDKFEEATGKSIEDISKEYALCQSDTFGKSTGLQNLVEKYADDQNTFADKLSSIISIAGITCIIAGAVISFAFPPAAGVGMSLMTAGRYISLSGMFVNNAMDLVDDSTDADGLTKEEIADIALETGVEAVSYASGRTIGKFTNGLNTLVSGKAASAGMGNIGSHIAGQTVETTADTVMSLGADFVIAQGQSLITTGEFMTADDYWSMDRFLGEGKNQLIGILTGLASGKINSYQQGIYASAAAKLSNEDPASIKQYMENSGLSNAQIDKFFEGIDIETVAKNSTLTAADNPTLSKMLAENKLTAETADIFAKYGLSDSQIKKAQNMIADGLTPNEAAICANYNLSSKMYNNARKISDNNADISFAVAANISKNSDVYNMLCSERITLEDASIYAARNFNTSQIKAAMEFKNKYPETNTSQAAIISSNKTISKMFETGKILNIEDAVIYSEMGLTKFQVQNAQKLQQDEQLSTSAASILVRNEVVFNMYKKGEITSLDDALQYAQDYKYKGEVIKAMAEKEKTQSSSNSSALLGNIVQSSTTRNNAVSSSKSPRIEGSSKTTSELLQDAIKGTEFESYIIIDDISRCIDYAYNRLTEKGVQLTREDIIQISEKIGYSDTSIIDLTGRTNEFGKAYMLSKLMDNSSVSEDVMASITKEITETAIFNISYRDHFTEILKASNLANDAEVYEKIAKSITEGKISTIGADIILENIESFTSSDIKFIVENFADNDFYTEQEYIQTFLYFKNLQTNNGTRILNMDEIANKIQQFGMGDTAANIDTDAILYKNIKAMMDIDPSSVNASYMTMLIDLIQRGDVNASALRSLDSVDNLKSLLYSLAGEEDPNPINSDDKWSFSPNLINDIDKMCNVIASNQNKVDLQSELLDAFIPKVQQDSEGINKVNIGDVFKIEGEDGIRIKSSDTESVLLNISEETYYKLFPPVERYATSQQVLGNCYCIENMMLLYSLPDQRVKLLEMFSEDDAGNIKIKLPGSDFEIVFENGEFPENQQADLYSSGAKGYKMLEYAYAKVLVEDEIKKAVQNLSGEELSDFCEFIEQNPNNVFVYQNENGQISYMKYTEAFEQNPKLIEEVLKTRNGSDSLFGTLYPTFASTLSGNGGTQVGVLGCLGYESSLYLPSMELPSDREIDLQIEEIKNNPNLDQDTKDVTIQCLEGIKNMTPEEKQEYQQQIETIYKTYENYGVERNKIKTIDETLNENLKNPNFYKENIVQLGIGGHAYGLTCETDSNGNIEYYLYNPHHQGVPIKITDIDAFFEKEDLIQFMAIAERK